MLLAGAIIFAALYAIWLLLQRIILPAYIRRIIKKVVLKRTAIFHSIHVKKFTDYGMDLSIIYTIPYSKLKAMFSFFYIDIEIATIQIYDPKTNKRLAKVKLSNPIHIDGLSDIVIKQSLQVYIADNVFALQSVLKSILLGGKREVDRTNILVEFTIEKLTIMNLLKCYKIGCKKLINFGQLAKEKRRFLAMKKLEKANIKHSNNMDAISAYLSQKSNFKPKGDVLKPSMKFSPYSTFRLTSNEFTKDLFPHPTIKPFLSPNLGGFHAGCHIQFTKPPGLGVSLKEISFRVEMNESTIATCTIKNLEFSQLSKDTIISMQILPAAISRPISGTLDIASSILKGALAGTLNGVFYGNWGSGSTILKLKDVSILPENSCKIDWLEKLLDSIFYERDLEAIQFLGIKLSEFLK